MQFILHRASRRDSSIVPASLGLGGLVAGAMFAYWFDPQRGAKRRTQTKQKALHAAKEAAEAADVTARDIAHRSRGLVAQLRGRAAEARGRLRGDIVDNEVLAERVRAKLGRVSSHPHAIEVNCHNGRVELKGPILKSELNRTLRGVRKVRGVRQIDNRLEPHKKADGVPGLQGGTARMTDRRGLLHENWSPTARLLVGAAGVSLLRWGIGCRGLRGIAASAAGVGLLARSLTNRPLKRLMGIGGGRGGIDLREPLEALNHRQLKTQASSGSSLPVESPHVTD